MTARAAQWIVWGFKPTAVTEPIRLVGGDLRACRSSARLYQSEGWTTAIYGPDMTPEGLRARVRAGEPRVVVLADTGAYVIHAHECVCGSCAVIPPGWSRAHRPLQSAILAHARAVAARGGSRVVVTSVGDAS